MAALRFTLWVADRQALLEAGGDLDELPLCPVDAGDLGALAYPLAGLVIGARRELARYEGITDPAGQAEFARGQLQRELEILEMFSGLEAELGGDPS